MENLTNKQVNKTKKSDKKNLSSNPIGKVKSPIENAPMISVPKNPFSVDNSTIEKVKETKTTKKKLEKLIKPISVAEETSLNSIVETINNFNTTITKSRLYNTEPDNTTFNINSNINYFDIMKSVSDAFQNNNSIVDLFNQLNNIFVNKLKWCFIGFGLLHEQSKCINLKIHSNAGNSYSSKVFLSDENNPIIQCFKTKSIIEKDNINYLNIPYLMKTGSVILPMMSVNKCIGVMLVGQCITNINTNIVTFFSNYMGMFIHNVQLLEQTSKYANTDTLTSLYNHRGFQEKLAKELEKAKSTEKPLSVVMFDVNNISKINRELGHAKGDEVIKIIAEKVKQNIRNTDIDTAATKLQ